ncbi:MAG: ABC transporter substrate-binding protein [Oleispira sp.]|nr:ABC transporter substrate-binding protein [Oleispira sp.]
MPTFISLNSLLMRFILLSSCFISAQITLAAEDPRQIIETAAKEMTSRLITDKDKIANQEYYLEQLVDELLLPFVDHEFMAKRVLAKNWKKASTSQKQQFTKAFKHKVIRTYAGAFKAFNGESIIFEDAKYNKSGKKASVKSAIQRSGAPAINVTYKLYLKNDHWLTYDVVIEGVSLVKSFRDQLSQSINKHGIAQAISALASEYKSETPILIMAGGTWTPYISNQLPANGLAVHIVTAVMSRAGYQVEMKFMPWQRVSEGLASGDIDISVGSWYNETRAKETKFTDAYLTNNLMIIKRKNDPLSFNSIEEFKQNVKKKGYRLGVFKDYGYGNDFNEVAPLVSINYYKYCSQMMRDVATKESDLALLDHWTAIHSMQNKQNIADHLEITPTPLITRDLYVTISHKNSQYKLIAEAFNQTLKAMKADGSYNKILQQHHYPL